MMNLQAQIAALKPGATLVLTGDYGAQPLERLVFAPNVRIDCTAATFASLSLYLCQGLDFVGLNVKFPAPLSSNVGAVSIKSSSRISLLGGSIVGSPATNGADPNTATKQDPSGNVRGFPAGYGVYIYQSQNVTVSGLEITQVDRGISFSGLSDSSIDHNHIHHTRRTSILGTPGANVSVSHNHTHDINPWHFGQTALDGDHADHAAFWVDPSMTTPVSGFVYSGNLNETGGGSEVLGFWLQPNAKGIGFAAPTISLNSILIGYSLALALQGCTNPVVSFNTLLQTAGDPAHQTPMIRLQAGTSGATGDGNIVSQISDISGKPNHIGFVVPPTGIASRALLSLARRAAL